jgi:hypothetical protein
VVVKASTATRERARPRGGPPGRRQLTLGSSSVGPRTSHSGPQEVPEVPEEIPRKPLGCAMEAFGTLCIYGHTS